MKRRRRADSALHFRGECITVEACDYQKGEVSEIFRQYLAPSVPADAGGFTVPEDAKAQ